MHSVTSGELMTLLKLDGVLGAIHHDGNGLGEFIVLFLLNLQSGCTVKRCFGSVMAHYKKKRNIYEYIL